MKQFLHFIDTMNEYMGKYFVSWFLLPMTFLISCDVILRYIFDRPTIWAWDLNIQFLAVMTLGAAGYTQLHNSHVNVDILVMNFKPRTRAIIDLITSPFFFLGVIMLLWKGAGHAWISVQTLEVSESYWAPPVWPLKIIIVIGIFLLLLQGIAKFIRDLKTAISPKEGS